MKSTPLTAIIAIAAASFATVITGLLSLAGAVVIGTLSGFSGGSNASGGAQLALFMLICSCAQIWSIFRFLRRVGRTRIEFVIWTGTSLAVVLLAERDVLWIVPLLWGTAAGLGFTASVDDWME